jgi:hypothetical protein
VAIEYVEGQTLRAWLAEPRSHREVILVMKAAQRSVGLLRDALVPLERSVSLAKREASTLRGQRSRYPAPGCSLGARAANDGTASAASEDQW